MKRILPFFAVPLFAASAVSINPLAPAEGFNVLVKEETTLQGSRLHGGLATGGNLNVKAQTYEVINDIHQPYKVDGKTVQVVVGGRVNFTGRATLRFTSSNEIRIGDLTGVQLGNRNGNTFIGTGSFDSGPKIELQNKQNAASITGPSGIDFDAAFASLEANSHMLSQIAPTGTGTSLGGGQMRFDLQTGANVFSLTGEQLNAISEIKFSQKPTLDRPVVFNIAVGGADFVWKTPNFPDPVDPAYVLFNFFDATGNVTIGGHGYLRASVLAPKAHLIDTNNTDMVGQYIAKSFTHNGGQIHDSPFKGVVEVPLTPVSVPETGSTLMFGALALAAVLGAAHVCRGRRIARA